MSSPHLDSNLALDADEEEASLKDLQGHSITYRIALGPHKGRKAFMLQSLPPLTTHVIFEPLDFLARLASLVPSPRVNLTRFHGCFAPHHRLRAQIVPGKRGRGARAGRTSCNLFPLCPLDERCFVPPILRAVERRALPVGANPTRQLSFQPVVIGAVVEVTKQLEPSVQRVTR